MNKKIIDTEGMEFGYELIKVIPYAYYLFKRNELESVITCRDMKWFYYFINCEEKYIKRRGNGYKIKIGKIENIHVKILDMSEWLPPNYKEYYKNDVFKFDRPLCIFSNKYTLDWGMPPINFLDLEVLKKLVEYLKDKYIIVYNRQLPNVGVVDHQRILDYGDFDMLRNYEDVIFLHDLVEKYNMSYNELQIKLYSCCDKFVSVQGGNSILSSYFGGMNIIYVKKGGELKCDSYMNWYHQFAGTKIIVARNNDQLIKVIKENY